MLPETVGRPMEILLVEDDLLQARLAIEAVKMGHFPHRATLVNDGKEALDFVFRRGVFRRAPRPDLVLLDLRLPEIDGLDVLAAIKEDEVARSLPVVIMTSSSDQEDRQTCERYEVAAYLTKPLNLKKFLTILAELKQFWHADMILPSALAEL